MPTRSTTAESSANLACVLRGAARAPGLACNASMFARSGQDSPHGRCSRFRREYHQAYGADCWSEVTPMQRIVIFLLGLVLGGGLMASLPSGKAHDDLTGALARPERSEERRVGKEYRAWWACRSGRTRE